MPEESNTCLRKGMRRYLAVMGEEEEEEEDGGINA